MHTPSAAASQYWELKVTANILLTLCGGRATANYCRRFAAGQTAGSGGGAFFFLGRPCERAIRCLRRGRNRLPRRRRPPNPCGFAHSLCVGSAALVAVFRWNSAFRRVD